MMNIARFVCLSLCGIPLSAIGDVDLPRATPESQGVSSASLLCLVDELEAKVDGIHSLMVVRHGQVIAEGWWAPYDAPHNHVLYSLSKSFTSTAIGFAVQEELLSIDDPVVSFFPDRLPKEASSNLKAMRVRDLLTMSAGHQDETSAAPDAISAATFLAHPVPHTPGTHFKYNTPATFMLSAILQKVAGATVLDYLKPRLFTPLGIDNPQWETNHQGISLGGYGLRVRTEDIAKLGQLYLQGGVWDGRRLLREEWISMATSKQTSNGSDPENDWNQGYGFQFWRCRHNAYRGDGAFGQFCIVMPDQDTVIAVTSGTRNMGAVMNVVWDVLLPSIHEAPLEPSHADHGALQSRLSDLALPTPEGKPTTEISNPHWDTEYRFSENELGLESLTLHANKELEGLNLVMQFNGDTVTYPCAFGSWAEGRAPVGAGRLAQFDDEPIAGAFAWERDDLLNIRVTAFETPFQWRFRLTFHDASLTLESATNVGFGSTRYPILEGHSKN